MMEDNLKQDVVLSPEEQAAEQLAEELMEMETRHLCPVCGRHYFEEAGDYDICPICNWENDPVQERDPDFEGGANQYSLNQAIAEYRRERKEEWENE